MALISFLLFYLFIYFLGRGLIIFLENITGFKHDLSNFEILGMRASNFYPLFALFLIGNLNIIFNFFAPTKNLIFFYSIFLFFNFFKITSIKEINWFAPILPVSLILSISTYGNNLAQDAGLYHLNTQQWIRLEKIHIGLTNLHSRYGYSSIYDYISSSFWIDNNLILIHFINLSFILLFYVFLFNNLFNNKNRYLKILAFCILLFGFLDNFGLSGGRNGFIDIESITKYDTPFAIIYFLTITYIIDLCLKNKITLLDIYIIFFLATFAVQLRIFGVTIFPFILILIKKFLEINQFKNLKLPFLIYIFFFTNFVLKNIFISGCLLFPVYFTCYSFFEASNTYIAKLEAIDLSTFHISYKFGDNIFEWFALWAEKGINQSTFLNFIVSIVLILILKNIFFKNIKEVNDKKLLYLFLASLMFSFIFWIVSAPAIRFGIGIFLITFSVLLIPSKNNIDRFFISKRLRLLVFLSISIFCLIFTLRIGSYSNFLANFDNPLTFEASSIEYKKNEKGWGVIPNKNSSCWVNIECIPESKKILKVDGFFNSFSIEK